MKRIVLAVVLGLGLARFAPCLVGSDASAPAPTDADARDLVFLGESGPILIRLHLQIEGKPLQEAWDGFVAELFRFLDRDGDGVLSDRELALAPRPALLLQLLRGNPPMMQQVRSATPEAEVSLVGGKVTRQGLATYYRISGVEPFLAFIEDRSSTADLLTEALLKHLDRDGDGRLSKEEVLAAPTALRKLDLNDDEMISLDELLPDREAEMDPQGGMRSRLQPLTDDADFLLLTAGDPPSRLAAALLTRYDKDKSDKLARSEIALDRVVFDKLDQDHDGELDATELAKYRLHQPPQLELTISFSPALEVPRVTVKSSDRQAAPARPSGDGSLELVAGASVVAVDARGGLTSRLEAARRLLRTQFDGIDTKKRGYLERSQLKKEDRTLSDLFAVADRDSDGKLTWEELSAYLDLIGNAMASSVVLTLTDRGRGLFDLLNARHDGYLRQRELLGAWDRLAPWDKDGNGVIERSELPHQFQLLLTQGQPGNGLTIAEGVFLPVPPERGPAASAAGPLWFRKMDRNGDGYVSLREFLGTKEEFQRIDTDGDGLISPEEATRADERLRKRSP
jgi:Ca2+-binding EF-hand superfamily protein